MGTARKAEILDFLDMRYDLTNGQIELLPLLMFLLMVTRIYGPILSILANLSSLLNLNVVTSRMRTLFTTPAMNGNEKTVPNCDIELSHVTFAYNREDVIKDVSCKIPQGSVTALVGPSGSGKSTIAKMLTHLESITDGKVILKGKDITNIKGKELREIYRDIQMVFQMPMESFDPRCTLGDGIGESLRNMGISRTETRRKVEELLERCGLEKEYADRYPHQVSGGQCQRAAIARALAVNPSILICDEATSALDVTVQKQILELLIELKKKENLSFILICHDLALVQAFCDRVLVLYHGKTVESGTLDETIDHPKMDYTRKLIDSVL